jgi:hypothetical protein
VDEEARQPDGGQLSADGPRAASGPVPQLEDLNRRWEALSARIAEHLRALEER